MLSITKSDNDTGKSIVTSLCVELFRQTNENNMLRRDSCDDVKSLPDNKKKTVCSRTFTCVPRHCIKQRHS